MTSSPASNGYDPKQVEVNLDSGMMTGDPASSPSSDGTSTPAKSFDDDWSKLMGGSDAAKPAQETSVDAAKPTQADTTSDSSSEFPWVPKKLATLSSDSSVGSAAVSDSAAPSSDGSDLVKEFASQHWSWDTPSSATPKSQDAPPANEFQAEMKRLTSSLSSDVFVQKRARGHTSHHMVRPGGPHLVSIKLFKTETKETVTVRRRG